MDSRGKRLLNFDLLNSPLEGTNLIEASAGTGKTFTITCLFLRLLLEKRLTVNDILVVTYTVAATEELRDRVRRKIREALEAFSRGDSPDSFLKGLVKQIKDRGDAISLLRTALRDFDQSSIFTIHSFCQRTLHESAFESGSLFDTELEPDLETGLMEEIVQDFWRRHFYRAPVEFVSYALSKKFRPAYFLDLLQKGTSHLDLKISPKTKSVGTLELEPFYRAFEKIKRAWPLMRAEVKDKLSDPALFSEYGNTLFKYLEMMDDYTDGLVSTFPLPEHFEKFTTASLGKKTRKGKNTPNHPFFNWCDEVQKTATLLQEDMDVHLLVLKEEIFQTLQKELPERKKRRNIQSFNDLLSRLSHSLEKAGGDELSETIRGRYKAALVDEFQDTDPIQYAIFRNVFGQGGAILFLIGDPKQAIYSFRGADLFAYMKAAGQVDSRYTLTRNWRSEPGLITAVNTIFSNGMNPFLYRDIPFEKGVPGENKDYDSLTIKGKTDPPFHLWFVDADNTEDIIIKEIAYELIPKAVAGEISRLILMGKKGETFFGRRPLREADIAVLTRTNREAQLIQDALSELKIPSVLYSTGNLFDTHEAMEMSRVLKGIANPHQERAIRAALATDMIGVNGETIEALQRDEAGWEEWLSRFREYYELWERYGFIRMFRYFLLREAVRSHLLSLPNGERRLTNVLHLCEVLHQAAMEEKLRIVGLLKWLARQRDPASPRLEEHQLRLESDANAVKVVTIHKSKGLEYSIVFCPFGWAKSKIAPKEVYTYHDEADDWRVNLVLDPEKNSNRPLAEREELAENMRLLYVSLTRAKHRCYLVWGRFRDAETSSLAYILHPPGDRAEIEKIVEETGSHFKAMTQESIRQDLRNLEVKSKGAILLADMPRNPGKEVPSTEKEMKDLSSRTFSISMPHDWRVASFSSLTASRREGENFYPQSEEDLPDHDRRILSEEPVLEEEPWSIFAFPRGAKAGSLLHDIFENLDFMEKDPGVEKKLIDDKLREYGFAKDWQETLSRMIARVLKVPLPSPSNRFTLSQISRQERLSELEFYFPLEGVTPKKLKTIFADHGRPEIPGNFPRRLEELNFSPARGFMKGFIDLIFQSQGRFFIVDWKSNFLGNRVEDYNQDKMAREMEDNFYILQSSLYVLALHQYLKARLLNYRYQQHFGGIFYIFLRGVDPQKGNELGVYRGFPREELVEALSKNLISPQTSRAQKDSQDR
jgi:exodeoxyribonuclease V beta subunit